MVLTFESVDEILKSDHSNEGYLKAVLFCGAVGYAGVMLYKVAPMFEQFFPVSSVRFLIL